MKKWLILILLLALGLRWFKLGAADLNEDEFTTQKAVSYINYCQESPENCRQRPASFRSRLIALITNNETKPNLFSEIYLWDFIKDRPSEIHHSRAWPYLHLAALIQRWLGVSEWLLRLVGALAGSLIVPVGFIFARYFSGSTGTGLIYSLVLAIAFPLIDYSRNARMYAPFITLGLLMVYLWHRLMTQKNQSFWLLPATFIVSLFSYWVHSLTLLLFIAIYTYSVIVNRRWWGLFTGLLIIYATAGRLTGEDFFWHQYLDFSWPPHWQYLNWFYLIGLGLLAVKRQYYLLIISAVYLIIVAFFVSWHYGSAYAIVLWPIMLLPFLTWRRWLAALTVLAVGAILVLKINYLYFGRDGRGQIRTAYQVIKDNFQPGNKIYAVQLRDYYLQTLPSDTVVIDLQKNPYPEFFGSGFVVWEKEKAGHFQPSVLEYIKTNLKHMAGAGLDNFGVEIYSFGK